MYRKCICARVIKPSADQIIFQGDRIYLGLGVKIIARCTYTRTLRNFNNFNRMLNHMVYHVKSIYKYDTLDVCFQQLHGRNFRENEFEMNTVLNDGLIGENKNYIASFLLIEYCRHSIFYIQKY